MKNRIDPTVDFVFKVMLGSENRKSLTVHFLNAFLAGTGVLPIVDVTLLNPYNAKDAFDDKETIVDVMARDVSGRLFQIEMQSVAFRALPERMLLTWAQLYSKQSVPGQDYKDLCPAASIWIVNDHISALGAGASPEARGQRGPKDTVGTDDSYHRFVVYDPERKVQLSKHLTLVTMELPKLKVQEPRSDRDRWSLFLRDALLLDKENLPEYMETFEMREALNVLDEIEQNSESWHAYQARKAFLWTQASIASDNRELKAELLESRSLQAKAEEHAAQVQRSLLRSEREKKRAEREKQQAIEREQQAEREKQQAIEREQRAEREKQQAIEREQQAEREKQQALELKQRAEQQVLALEAMLKQLQGPGRV